MFSGLDKIRNAVGEMMCFSYPFFISIFLKLSV